MVVLPRAIVLSLGLVLVATASSALTITVGFDSDAPGPYLEPFTSVDSSLVHFSHTEDEVLLVASQAGVTTDGQGLGGFFSGGIRIDFDSVATSLSLDFGNDNPDLLATGDVFEMVVYLGSDVVDVVTEVPNRNLLVDQSIAYSANFFDAVEVRFTGGGGTEVIDNLEVTVVPEPSAALLFGLGALVVGSASRSPQRRRPVVRRRD